MSARTEKITKAVTKAHDMIRDRGWTPCSHSWFESCGRVYCFSSESAGGRSSTGPACEVTIELRTGRVVLDRRPHRNNRHVRLF